MKTAGNQFFPSSLTTSTTKRNFSKARTSSKRKSTILLTISYSVNVSMVNFCDMLIDYPNSKDYAFSMFEKLCEMELLSAEMLPKYK